MRFWKRSPKYNSLLQRYVDRGVENERLKLINSKLLARSKRFRLACVSLEKQKTPLLIRVELAEARVALLEKNGREDLAIIAKQIKTMARLRVETLRLIEEHK